VWECPKGRANEALDCRVYAYAALSGLLQLGMKLNLVVDAVALPPAPAPRRVKVKAVEGSSPPSPPSPPTRPKGGKFAKRSGSWMNRRR
ncbi:MAG: hypothetical protein QM690_21965, partial [Sphingobium sp.]